MVDTDVDVPAGRETTGTGPNIGERPDGCTFDPREWAILARYWYPVAWSEDVHDRPFPSTLLDEDLVVYRTSGGVVVTRDLCLHRGRG